MSTCYSPVRRSTRLPKEPFALDLHVLGTPPAFVLSQDQTLEFDSLLFGFLRRSHARKHGPSSTGFFGRSKEFFRPCPECSQPPCVQSPCTRRTFRPNFRKLLLPPSLVKDLPLGLPLYWHWGVFRGTSANQPRPREQGTYSIPLPSPLAIVRQAPDAARGGESECSPEGQGEVKCNSNAAPTFFTVPEPNLRPLTPSALG